MRTRPQHEVARSCTKLHEVFRPENSPKTMIFGQFLVENRHSHEVARSCTKLHEVQEPSVLAQSKVQVF